MKSRPYYEVLRPHRLAPPAPKFPPHRTSAKLNFHPLHEVARQIRVKCPKTKILFVSEDRPLDVVREALSIGAQGYVVRSDGVELLTAVQAARGGRFFVSKSLAEYSLAAADLDLSSR